MKAIIFSIWLVSITVAVGILFWYTDWKYQLPTPVPANYVMVPKGVLINLPGQLHLQNKKPVFLHFFNPDCPCSRFNMKHFKSLVKEYGQQVDFAIVVMNNERYSEAQIQEKFDLAVPVSFDSSIANLCGVYSTPQAVILDTGHHLYYRGNYNKNRYCTDKKTSYAQNAINNLINKQPAFVFDRYALTPYGCQLPQCTK